MDEDEGDAQLLAPLLLRLSHDPASLAILHRFFNRFSHRLRNRLNGIKLSLYLARRSTTEDGDRSALDQVMAEYDRIEHFMAQFQGLCRPPDLQLVEAPIVAFLRERSRLWSERLASHGQQLAFSDSLGDAEVAFDPSRFGEALDGFVKWRSEQAGEAASFLLSTSRIVGQIVVEWTEKGPATPRPTPDASIPPGVPNLALPLLARLAAAHGGRLDVLPPCGYRILLGEVGVTGRSPRIPDATRAPTAPALSSPRLH